MSKIDRDKELIEELAKAHELSPEDLTRIITKLGLIKFFEDLKLFGSVKIFNEFLATINEEIKK